MQLSLHDKLPLTLQCIECVCVLYFIVALAVVLLGCFVSNNKKCVCVYNMYVYIRVWTLYRLFQTLRPLLLAGGGAQVDER